MDKRTLAIKEYVLRKNINTKLLWKSLLKH